MSPEWYHCIVAKNILWLRTKSSSGILLDTICSLSRQLVKLHKVITCSKTRSFKTVHDRDGLMTFAVVIFYMGLESSNHCLQCFDAVGWGGGGQEGPPACKKLSCGVLAWLSVWSEVQTCIWPRWCHCHSQSLASIKSTVVLPFWYRLTWVVPEKGH